MEFSMRRGAWVGLMVTALVLASEPRVDAHKPGVDVGPGRIAWFDLSTTKLASSREFYSKLVGWEFTPVQGTDLAVEIVSRGTSIGTLRVAEGKLSAFNGVVYVQVADMQAACKKAKDLGGKVVAGFPF